MNGIPPLVLTSAQVAEARADATPYDRTEDFDKPDGRTLHTCFACGNCFFGLPTRNSCRICATSYATS